MIPDLSITTDLGGGIKLCEEYLIWVVCIIHNRAYA